LASLSARRNRIAGCAKHFKCSERKWAARLLFLEAWACGATTLRKVNSFWDNPVLIQCYTDEVTLERNAAALREFLMEMGTETSQGAVGFVIDRDYYEIQFPLRGG